MPAKAGPKGSGGTGRAGVAGGEPAGEPVSDAPARGINRKARGKTCSVRALATDNMQRAWKRVKANRGSRRGRAGHRQHRSAAQERLARDPRATAGWSEYRPQAVRRVGIPKPDGSQRELGIPTVTDRLCNRRCCRCCNCEHPPMARPQPRLLGGSHTLRVLAAQRHVQEGYRVVVDVDRRDSPTESTTTFSTSRISSGYIKMSWLTRSKNFSRSTSTTTR